MEEREMKKIHLFIVTLITCSLITLFVACEKDEEIDLTTISVSNEQCTPSYTSATLQCSFATKATLRNVYVQYATTHDFAEYDEMEMSKSDDVYLIVLDSLQDNTTYYVRYAVSNRYSSAITEEISTFQTLQSTVPTITLKSISDIWDTHAKAEIALEFDGGSQISEMGICWNTRPSPVVENNKRTTKDTVVSLEIKDLQPNTQYFVRAYAMNKIGVAYSEEYEFKTYALPEIKTEQITDIQLTTALLNGTLLFNGNDTAVVKGFCWSENTEPTIEDALIQIDTIAYDFSYRLSNLNDETTYQVRAYAKNKIGIAYGEIVAFTTKAAILPTVVTTPVTEIDYHSAKISGNVTSDGSAEVTERGICYSTIENPTTKSIKIVSGKGMGGYTINLSNLQDSTTYYVRAYAINKKGIAYGEQVTFMTKGYKLPTITTGTPTNVEYTSATVGGNILSDGGASITECGICYSTSENPSTEDTKIVSGKGTGNYTINLSNLLDSTTYYVRAYAINKKGVSYGENMSFMTKGYKPPMVTTSAPTNVSYTSASAGGNVTSDGGATITERGVVYDTSPNPTTSNSKKASESGLDSFTVDLTNLSEGVTYYVRAYAINKKGISYGEQARFTTETLNGYQYVDLGLSVKWATCNIGANKPEEYGNYFAWGETRSKSVYNESNYSYNEDPKILPLSADAAHVNWGGAWRMPTIAECRELCEHCTWKWIFQNGIKGYKVTSKNNGNSIFLPAAGYKSSTSIYCVGSRGYYHSSSLKEDDPYLAFYLFMNSDYDWWGLSSGSRESGLSIRPVCP